MDGLAKTDDLVFVLCATNLPWELDSAMLRRLEKRIMVRRIPLLPHLNPTPVSSPVIRTETTYYTLHNHTCSA